MHCGGSMDTWAARTENTTEPRVHQDQKENTHSHTTIPLQPSAQITCLLLLLLLNVPDLSTAFLILLTFCTISLATFGLSASKSYLFVPPSLWTTSLKDEEDLADCWQATTERMWYEEVRPFSNIPVARLADGMICVVVFCECGMFEFERRCTYVEVNPVDRQNPLVSSHKHGQLPGDNVFLRK